MKTNPPCVADPSRVLLVRASRDQKSGSVRGRGGWAVGLLLAGALGVVGCVSERRAEVPAEWRAWQERRQESIAGTNGWLTLAGLHWLREGDNPVGSDPTNAVVLPAGKAPGATGVLVREGHSVRFRAAAGAGVLHEGRPVSACEMVSDEDGSPTRLQVAGLVFWVLDRGERMGVRVREPGASARLAFRGTTCFPYDARWRVEGRFVPYPAPEALGVRDSTGGRQELRAVGDLVFAWRGREYRLQAVEEKGEADLFVIFRDRTAGESTYGAGRFLYVKRPTEGDRVVLDFNHAYNPPCAFTAFATCPRPPSRNWLPFPVRAGERKPEYAPTIQTRT